MSPLSPTVVGWDLRHARRAAGGACVALALVTVTTALTDEGGVAWGVRLGRALPLVPLCAALGTYLALSRQRTRAEMLGLQALGRSPQASSLGAVVGGALVAWAAALALVAWPAVDVDGFYPSVVRAAEIRFEPEVQGGTFVMSRDAVRVLPNGDLGSIAPTGKREELTKPPEAPSDLPTGGRASAALVTFFAGTALALIAATLRGPPRRLIAASLALTLPATVLLFHAAAAHRASPYFAGLAPLALLVHATLRYRRWGWALS